MATLRFLNPTTETWDLLSIGGGASEDHMVFGKLDTFPAVGESNKLYIDTSTSKLYIYTPTGYEAAGDGQSTADWGNIT